MLKILVTYAVQGEFVEIKWPDVEPYYIRTGIGKVKSAFHLAEAIRQVQRCYLKALFFGKVERDNRILYRIINFLKEN